MVNDDLDSRLSELEAGAGVAEGDTKAWAEAVVEQALRAGSIDINHRTVGQEAESAESVCLYSNGMNISVPRSAVPEWVDLDKLPVDS